MTLDEAIKKCEEAAQDRDKLRKSYDDASGYSRSHNESIRTNDAKECEKCSQDFRQIAEWLKELKALKAEPCEDAISRADLLKNQTVIIDDDGLAHKVVHIGRICAAPSVIPTREK